MSAYWAKDPNRRPYYKSLYVKSTASVASASSVAAVEAAASAGEFGLRNPVHQRARSGLRERRSRSVPETLYGHDAEMADTAGTHSEFEFTVLNS